MAFNRLVDREIDAANPRTANRHLPAKLLSIHSVSRFTVAAAVSFVFATLLFLPNRLPLYLAAPVLALLGSYSYAKRFTSLSHFWLGAALACAPVATWIALRGAIVLVNPADILPAVCLAAAVWTWVAGFDIIYACPDFEFDREHSLHSLPAQLGLTSALRVAGLCHLATLAFLAILPWAFPPLGSIYLLGVLVVACLLVYEHLLVRPDDLTRVNRAFFHVNAVISLGLVAVGSLDLWLSA